MLENGLTGYSSTTTKFTWFEDHISTVLEITFKDSIIIHRFIFGLYQTDTNGQEFYVVLHDRNSRILNKGHKVGELVDWMRNEMIPK
jgi:hypothetical protein